METRANFSFFLSCSVASSYSRTCIRANSSESNLRPSTKLYTLNFATRASAYIHSSTCTCIYHKVLSSYTFSLSGQRYKSFAPVKSFSSPAAHHEVCGRGESSASVETQDSLECSVRTRHKHHHLPFGHLAQNPSHLLRNPLFFSSYLLFFRYLSFGVDLPRGSLLHMCIFTCLYAYIAISRNGSLALSVSIETFPSLFISSFFCFVFLSHFLRSRIKLV